MKNILDSLAVEQGIFGKIHKERIGGGRGKLRTLKPGETIQIKLTSPGLVRRIWFVFNALAKSPASSQKAIADNPKFYRNISLRINFDDAEEDQVNVPIADFFLFGHGSVEDIDSRWIQTVRVPPLARKPFQGALNCFMPMPFNEKATIELQNNNNFPITLMGLIDWQEREKTDQLYTFRATYKNHQCDDELMVVFEEENVKGVVVGLGLNVKNDDMSHRWHEACDYFQIDDEAAPIVGTGLEDYFCMAWGFRKELVRKDFGVPHICHYDNGLATLAGGRANPRGEFTMYRFNPLDYVSFKKKLRFYFRGNKNAQKPCRLENNLSVEFRSVVFWYSTKQQ